MGIWDHVHISVMQVVRMKPGALSVSDSRLLPGFT